MFYKNKSTLKTTLALMANNPDNILLMSTIYKCYKDVDLNDIPDVETRELCRIVQKISSDIQTKGIRTPNVMRDYIRNSSLNNDIQSLILGMKQRYDDSLLKSYNTFFSKHRLTPSVEKLIEDLNDNYDQFKKSGIENTEEHLSNFLSVAHQLEDAVKELTKSTTDNDVFVVDVSKGIDKVQTIGMEKLEQGVNTTVNSKVKTGMWIDHMTGGGFTNKNLYLVASIAGGFKSGFLQNVAERISTYMKPEDFLVPDGVTPVIYYLNLEMTSTQLLERRCSFYGTSMDEIMLKVEDPNHPSTITKEVAKMLDENGSRLPVLYEQGKTDYDIHQIKLKMKEAEQMGYKVVCLIVDYIDLMKYEASIHDQLELKYPIVAKASDLRDLAKEYDIPVITAAQMNRQAEEVLKNFEHRAASEDLITRISSAQLAKAHSLKAIPEQIYMCYKFTINDKDYFSIIVDKDRQNKARYIKPEQHKLPDEVMYNRKKKPSTRVMYVAPLEGFKISDTYADTIKVFETDADDSVMEIMESEPIDV